MNLKQNGINKALGGLSRNIFGKVYLTMAYINEKHGIGF
jgi:hypothetical protein